MCIGLPARVIESTVDHPELVIAELGGARRQVNLGALTEEELARVGPDTWVLVHLGYAIKLISAQEANDALAALADERRALLALLGEG